MEKWDIVCMRCGKHLFSEQIESIAGDIHRTNETNDEYTTNLRIYSIAQNVHKKQDTKSNTDKKEKRFRASLLTCQPA